MIEVSNYKRFADDREIEIDTENKLDIDFIW